MSVYFSVSLCGHIWEHVHMSLGECLMYILGCVCVQLSVCPCTQAFGQETKGGCWPAEGLLQEELEVKSGGQGLGPPSPCCGPHTSQQLLTSSTSHLGQGLFTTPPPPCLSSLGLCMSSSLLLKCPFFFCSLKMPVHPSAKISRLRSPLSGEDSAICRPAHSFYSASPLIRHIKL